MDEEEELLARTEVENAEKRRSVITGAIMYSLYIFLCASLFFSFTFLFFHPSPAVATVTLDLSEGKVFLVFLCRFYCFLRLERVCGKVVRPSHK